MVTLASKAPVSRPDQLLPAKTPSLRGGWSTNSRFAGPCDWVSALAAGNRARLVTNSFVNYVAQATHHVFDPIRVEGRVNWQADLASTAQLGTRKRQPTIHLRQRGLLV